MSRPVGVIEYDRSVHPTRRIRHRRKSGGDSWWTGIRCHATDGIVLPWDDDTVERCPDCWDESR